MKRGIIIFTRVPVPGQTKTRMMPFLDAKECALLHSCFIKDIRHECEKVNADLFVCYTPGEQREKLYEILEKQTEYFVQTGDNLGERMYRAFEHVFKYGYESCLLIGTDVPELKNDYLNRAFRELEVKDIVFGLTADGGYYLVGMKRPRREVFDIPSYGHENVWDDTLHHLNQKHLSIGYTAKLDDMDTPDDLDGYRVRMRINKELQNTETGKFLMKTSKISIIIPTYNEEKTILKIQEQLKRINEKCEIIFVDGGSTDTTLELINPDFQVIHAPKGRATQMNAAAKISTGDILLFLHCDSELPDKPLLEIREVMKNHRAGCFGIAFRSKQFFLMTCQVISNYRAKKRKIMFGDQGIFVDRQLFFEAGMFPEIPIMEDYQFSLTLKAKGVKLGMTRHHIYTSDRRFPRENIAKLKVMWKMNRLRKMYRDGMDIHKISDMYRDVR